MIDVNKMTTIAEEFLQETDLFLVDLSVSRNNKVVIALDGDNGVKIADCIALSRHITACFDREVEDFELEVSSVGVGNPLLMPRQYRNNIGREIAIARVGDTRLRGKLLEVKPDGIVVERVLPKVKKKDKTEPMEANVFIPFEDIEQAKIQPSFK